MEDDVTARFCGEMVRRKNIDNGPGRKGAEGEIKGGRTKSGTMKIEKQQMQEIAKKLKMEKRGER
jgi:hypothetical protein